MATTTLPILTRAQLGEAFKDPRTVLAFEAFTKQVALDIPSSFASLAAQSYVVTTLDPTIPNAHLVTAGTGMAITTGTGSVTLSTTSAPKWTFARSLTFTGDAAGTLAGVDGSANVSGTLTLAIVNSSPGTYVLASLTVDSKGRVTAAASASTTGTGGVVLASSPTITTPAIVGITNGTPPTAGRVGQRINVAVLSSSAVSLPGGADTNVITLPLTAGIWQVSGTAGFVPSGVASWTLVAGSIGLTSGVRSFNGDGCFFLDVPGGLSTGLPFATSIGPAFFDLSTAQNVYLVLGAAISGGAIGGYGSLTALRVA